MVQKTERRKTDVEPDELLTEAFRGSIFIAEIYENGLKDIYGDEGVEHYIEKKKKNVK